MRFEIIEDVNDFVEFHDAWNRLLAKNITNPLPLTHEWMVAWWKNFGGNRQLFVVCVYDKNSLVAIAPFMRDEVSYRGIQTTVLRLMANGHSPFCDVILDGSASEETISKITEQLVNANTADIMTFAKISETSSIHASLIADPRVHGHRYGVKDSLITPILTITGSWDDYFRGRSRKFRKNIANKLNRVTKEPDISINKEVVTSRHAPVLDEIAEVSSRSWKARIKNDLVSNTAGRGFLLDLVDSFGPEGAVHIWALRKAGVLVAFEFHLVHGDVVYPLRADFDENYRKISPGSVLEYTALKALFEEKNVSQYYSCADNYWYLNNWTNDVRKHFDVEVFASGIKPFMIHALEFRIIPLLRVAREKIIRKS